MHVKAQTSDRTQSHGQIGVDNSNNKKHAESKSDVAESNQHGTEQQLPNVNSLMKRYPLTAAFDTELCYHQPIVKCEFHENEIRQSTANRQQFLSVGEKYIDSETKFDKTNYIKCEQNGDNNSRDITASYMNQNQRKNSSNNKFGLDKSEDVVRGNMSILGELCDQKLDEACSVHPTNFSTHSQISSTPLHLEPLSLVIEQNEKHVDVQGARTASKSPVDDAYENDVSAWEQENDRFVHYSWRNDVYAQNAYVCDNSGDDSHANTLLKSSGFANNMIIDSNFSQAFLTGGSCANIGLSNRRRRRRVQTPVQRSAANMRERRRMCHLNVAFDRLKEHLPNIKHKQKLSRIQTLKAAIDYINLLQESLSLC